MGGDGGSIPTRDVLAKTKKKKKTVEQLTFGGSTLAKFTRCHLTSELLAEPIVCDDLGNLFNKVSLIESMINGKMPKSLSYIERISKDTVNCNVTLIEKKDPNKGALFECPITGLIANGKYGFVVLRKCGCFLSERALKNIKGTKCINCNQKMDEMINDYTQIPINSSDERRDKLFKMMMERKKTKKHKKKKSKKNKKVDVNSEKKTLCGKKRVLEEAEESVSKRMKTSHAYKSIFDRKQREFNFAGGGKGF